MKGTCYLVLNSRGVVRMAKRPPDLYAGEIAVRLLVSADDRHFRLPYAEANITLGERHIIEPAANVEVLDPPESDT